jgi:hypothetical protein
MVVQREKQQRKHACGKYDRTGKQENGQNAIIFSQGELVVLEEDFRGRKADQMTA